MTSSTTDETTHGAAKPQMWLTMPPGYVPTRPLDQDEADRLVTILTDGLSPTATEAIGVALEIAQAQARAQRAEHLTLSANGMHPRADGGVDLSTLTAGVVPVPSAPPRATLLGMAKAEQARPDNERTYTIDLPVGEAVVAERMITSTPQAAGAHVPEGLLAADAAAAAITLRSIRVIVVAPGDAHIGVVEIATKSLDAFDSYREVMLSLVAPSITFEDPVVEGARSAAAASAQSRFAERLGGPTISTASDTPDDTTQEAQ